MGDENILTAVNTGTADDRYDSSGDKHILVALDETDSSTRALLYVADFLGGYQGIRVTLLRIIPEPSEDFFDDRIARAQWIKVQYDKSIKVLEIYREVLVHSGFGSNNVDIKVNIMNCSSIAKSILEIQKKRGCCTVVVGRRAISRKEEFIFGSTTSKMLHTEKKCALWVVE
ncbi:MAG: universal stress protein [Nitrospirota bacterium]